MLRGPLYSSGASASLGMDALNGDEPKRRCGLCLTEDGASLASSWKNLLFPRGGELCVTELGVKVHETHFHDTFTKGGPKNCFTE